MRYASALLILAVLVSGCGDNVPETPAVVSDTQRDTQLAKAPEPPKDPTPQVTVSGMDLYMHETEVNQAGRRKPTLWVHADEGEMAPDRSWALTGADAVIYREEEEDIRLQSATGRFDESEKVALLEGGVGIEAGTLTMRTEAIRWDNTTRIADMDTAVEVSDGATTLHAESARLEPDDGAVTLREVRGELSLFGDPK